MRHLSFNTNNKGLIITWCIDIHIEIYYKQQGLAQVLFFHGGEREAQISAASQKTMNLF